MNVEKEVTEKMMEKSLGHLVQMGRGEQKIEESRKQRRAYQFWKGKDFLQGWMLILPLRITPSQQML